jgi:predicted enzyme related to lactoylglutathione lyase
MKRSIEFYTQKLGLTPEYADDNWAQFDLNGHALCLHPAGANKVVTGPAVGGCLIIEVTDIHKVVGTLKENRVEFVKEIQDIGCGLCADLKDLDGNVIGLYQHKPEGELKASGKDTCCA